MIIPYQEKLGNYNIASAYFLPVSIIPYQEKLGNYNLSAAREKYLKLYHTKKN